LVIEEEARLPAPAPARTAPPADPRQILVETGIQFLEALAGVIAGPPGETRAGADGGQGRGVVDGVGTTHARHGATLLQLPLPSPDLLQRGATALQRIMQGMMKPPLNAEAPR